jgi:branched-chain amino acid aminotransferase
MAAGRAAHRSGYDDALLIGRSGSILEGPTFSIGWVVDGAIETPTLGLGILASITRSIVLTTASDDGREVREDRFPLERLDEADEVFAMSTVKEVRPVVAVGARRFEPGPLTERLADAYRSHVQAEVVPPDGNPKKVRYR